MTTEEFYKFWEKYPTSNVLDELPDNIEAICAELEITVNYYIHEFL